MRKIKETLLVKILIVFTFGIILGILLGTSFNFNIDNIIIGLLMIIILLILYQEFRDLI